jgi:hypothetical protein
MTPAVNGNDDGAKEHEHSREAIRERFAEGGDHSCLRDWASSDRLRFLTVTKRDRLTTVMVLLRRHWALLLVLYILADFSDPSIPGVFVFDSGALFVDGVVQVKSNAVRGVTPAPMPRAHLTSSDADQDETTNMRAVTRPVVPTRPTWTNLKRDDSASFSSSPLPDSSPTPRS